MLGAEFILVSVQEWRFWGLGLVQVCGSFSKSVGVVKALTSRDTCHPTQLSGLAFSATEHSS